MTAADRFTRIVSLVADLTRRQCDEDHSFSLHDVASRHGVSEAEINADIRTLTILSDHVDASWLLSLSVLQQADHVSISSCGPFRRPIRFSPEEHLAIRVALALTSGGAPVAARFEKAWRHGSVAPSPPSPVERTQAEETMELVRRATLDRVEIELEYAGEGERESRVWALQPHQLARMRDRNYLVAWATDFDGWRHFRLDRAISAQLTQRPFTARDDFVPLTRPEDVFRPGEPTDRVVVRFAPSVAAWIAERYPEHEEEADGSLLVTFNASSPDWLVRRVLEYGTDAEVLEPLRYREAMRSAVA